MCVNIVLKYCKIFSIKLGFNKDLQLSLSIFNTKTHIPFEHLYLEINTGTLYI